MICPNCSANLPDKSIFCGKCGKKLVFPSVNQTPKELNTSNNQESIIQLDNKKSETNKASEVNELVEPITVSEQSEIPEQKKTSEEVNKKSKIEQDNNPKTAILPPKNNTPLNIPNDILNSQPQSPKQDKIIDFSNVAYKPRFENFNEKDRREKIIINIIAGLILVAVIAFIGVKALIPVYYRFTFDSIISNGNLADINNLIRDKKFIEYASDSQGQQALEFAATNIASSSLNEKYELMEETAFKKFENGNIGKLVVASMTDVVIKTPIEERLNFLKNNNVLLYINENQRTKVLSSIVDYPITEIDNSSLNKLFFEICNETEIENIFSKINEEYKDLPNNFINSLITAILNKPSSSKIKTLKEFLKKYESVKNYILLYAYESGRTSYDNNSDFNNKLEKILNSFPWCFNSEFQNNLKTFNNAIQTLRNAEKTANNERVDNELNRLKEKRNKIPVYSYIEGYIDEILVEGTKQNPVDIYLIKTYNGYSLLATMNRMFFTKGYFTMYVSQHNVYSFGLSSKLKTICEICNIDIVFVEADKNDRYLSEQERNKLTNEINEIVENAAKVKNLIVEAQNKVNELKDYLLKSLLYDSAISSQKNNKFEEAYNKFASIQGFKDSYQRLKELEKDSAYETAMNFFKEKKYLEALNKFKTISFYKDSANKIKECENNYIYETAINNFNNKNYQEALKQFEQIKNFKDSENKLLECKNYIKQFEYEAALNLFKNKNIKEALDKFKALGDYKDASTKVLECEKCFKQDTYDSALNMMENKNFQEAKDKFSTIEDYKDSSKKILECEENIKQNIYDSAIALKNVQKYQEAIDKFRTIKDFKDSSKKILECEENNKQNIYDSAIAFKNVQKYQEAIDKFRTIKNFKDSEKHINDCEKGIIQQKYEYANELMNNNRYKEAIENYKEIIDYKDSREKITKCSKNNFEFWVNNFEIPLAFCPAGKFTMGSHINELGRRNEETQHVVILSKPFAIGKYEVTQAQFEAVMGKNPSTYRWAYNPVESVSRHEAIEFCNKLNNKLNNKYINSLPNGYRFDLPTEAQWEYACRAGTKTALNNNKNLTSSNNNCFNLDEVAWYIKNSDYKPHPVGQKKPNAWGIYDMHGNVLEWCKDYKYEYLPFCITDPIIVKSDSGDCVARGGSCQNSADCCRSAHRYVMFHDYRTDSPKYGAPSHNSTSRVLGFRIVLIPTDYDNPIKRNLVPYLGLKFQNNSVNTQNGFKGFVISEVMNNSPAAKSNLKPMDIITEFNGKKIKEESLILELLAKEMDEPVKIRYLRNGKSGYVVVYPEQITIQEYLVMLKGLFI